MALSNAERQRRYRQRRKRELRDFRLGGSHAPAPWDRDPDARRRRIREAITTLAGNGNPADYARLFDGTDDGLLVDERLDEAVEWLTAFAAAFRTARATREEGSENR